MIRSVCGGWAVSPFGLSASGGRTRMGPAMVREELGQCFSTTRTKKDPGGVLGSMAWHEQSSCLRDTPELWWLGIWHFLGGARVRYCSEMGGPAGSRARPSVTRVWWGPKLWARGDHLSVWCFGGTVTLL